MRSEILRIAATAALLLGAAGAHAANPIANGNFDTPVVHPRELHLTSPSDLRR